MEKNRNRLELTLKDRLSRLRRRLWRWETGFVSPVVSSLGHPPARGHSGVGETLFTSP